MQKKIYLFLLSLEKKKKILSKKKLDIGDPLVCIMIIPDSHIKVIIVHKSKFNITFYIKYNKLL